MKHIGQTSVYSRDAVAQFNVNIKLKDGAYMTKSEIEAFNMYEYLKGARWLGSSVSSRLHKHHVYVKASIFVSRKIDRVACTILLQVRYKFNRYYLPYRYFTFSSIYSSILQKVPVYRKNDSSTRRTFLSFDLSPRFRKPVVIV